MGTVDERQWEEREGERKIDRERERERERPERDKLRFKEQDKGVRSDTGSDTRSLRWDC